MSSDIQRFPSLESASSSCTASEEFEPFYLHDDNGNKLSITRKLCESRFPIYLAENSTTQELFAIKFFTWDEKFDQPSPLFFKEQKFSRFVHPNIVSIISAKQECQIDLSSSTKVSYLVMDYAANGDLFELVITKNIHIGDIITRTYFRQLIAGLEAIHSQGAAHLDLKLENLLLDENFQLKIADFDGSFMPGDQKVQSKGSMFYRAPEVMEGCCYNPQAADIYSLGIILFLLKTDGRLPFDENEFCGDVNMRVLLRTNKTLFWRKQCELLGEKASFFTFDFRKLFERLTDVDPNNRPSLTEIKESVYYSKYTYSNEELPDHIIDRLNSSEENY